LPANRPTVNLSWPGVAWSDGRRSKDNIHGRHSIIYRPLTTVVVYLIRCRENSNNYSSSDFSSRFSSEMCTNVTVIFGIIRRNIQHAGRHKMHTVKQKYHRSRYGPHYNGHRRCAYSLTSGFDLYAAHQAQSTVGSMDDFRQKVKIESTVTSWSYNEPFQTREHASL